MFCCKPSDSCRVTSYTLKWMTNLIIFRTTLIKSMKSFQLYQSKPLRISEFSTTKPTKTKTFSDYPFDRDSLPDETLFIVDGTSMVFKSYFSEEKNKLYTNAKLSKDISNKLNTEFLAPREEIVGIDVVNKQGIILPDRIPCSHLIMMASQFAQLIEVIRPKYLVIVFDAGGKTFRNDIYSEYKQHRPEKPKEINVMFQIAPRIFEIFGCKCLKQPNYEADDVMATLGQWAHKKGLNVVHVSEDKDMLQCVSEGIHVMNPYQRTFYGIKEVIEKIGIPPKQLTDFFALKGDKSDGIPGVDGVGDKCAVALIKYFGNLENLINVLKLKTISSSGAGRVNEDSGDQMGGLPSASSHTSQNNILTDLNINDLSEATDLTDEEALVILSEALDGVRISKTKLWENLKAASLQGKLKLYKDLVTLRYDVLIDTPKGLGYEAFTHMNSTTFNRFISSKRDSNAQDITTSETIESVSVTLETDNLKLDVLRSSSHIVSDHIDTSVSTSSSSTTVVDGLLQVKSFSQTINYLDNLTTQHFRFTGESSRASEAITQISEHLLQPLNTLRYSYRNLNRKV